MNKLKIILVALIALILVLVLAGFLLPRNVTVVREATINASLWIVHSEVAAPTRWQNWGVWNERDPNMQLNYSGAGAGVGAKWSGQSKTEGNRDMEITADDAPRELAYLLKSGDSGVVSNGRFKFSPTNDVVTQVTWTIDSDLGNNPLNRYAGLFIDRLQGPDFAASLANLKVVAEKIAATRLNDGLLAPPVGDVETKSVEGAKVEMRDIPEVVDNAEKKDSK